MQPDESDLNDQERPPYLKTIWHARADLVLVLNFTLITGLYALLMIRDRVPQFGLAALGILWLLYWLFSGRLTFSTPCDLPILGLLGLLPLSLAISVDRDLSLPKIYGLLLGIALFYVIVNFFYHPGRLPLAVLGLIILAIVIILLGFISTDWATGRFTFLTPFSDYLHRSLAFIPGFVSIRETNPNTIGGALAFFPPLLLGLLWDRGGFKRMFLQHTRHPQQIYWLYKLVLLVTLLLAMLTIVLNGSRGSLLGAAFGLFAIAIWNEHRFLWLIPVLITIFLITLQVIARGNLEALIVTLDTNENFSLASRFGPWQAAVFLIQDFPFTGGGIGTFGRLSQAFYTFTSLSSQGTIYFHAHNNLLAAAVDLGLPGLVLYSTLLGGFTKMALHISRIGRTFIKALSAGLACGMLAHQAFGLMDAFMLGAKLGVVMWVFFGLMAALFVHRYRLNISRKSRRTALQALHPPGWDQIKLHLTDLLIGLALWIAISLAAATFSTLNPYLSITLAIAGGIVLGIILTKRYREASRQL